MRKCVQKLIPVLFEILLLFVSKICLEIQNAFERLAEGCLPHADITEMSSETALSASNPLPTGCLVQIKTNFTSIWVHCEPRLEESSLDLWSSQQSKLSR